MSRQNDLTALSNFVRGQLATPMSGIVTRDGSRTNKLLSRKNSITQAETINNDPLSDEAIYEKFDRI